MSTYSVTLDLDKRTPCTCTCAGQPGMLTLRQGDHAATTLVVSVTDHGVPYDLTGHRVAFEMRLPRSRAYYEAQAHLVEGNDATITIDETYAAASVGVTEDATVRVYDVDGLVASSGNLRVSVLRDPKAGADPAHAYESGIMAATEAANAAAQAALDAAERAGALDLDFMTFEDVDEMMGALPDTDGDGEPDGLMTNEDVGAIFDGE